MKKQYEYSRTAVLKNGQKPDLFNNGEWTDKDLANLNKKDIIAKEEFVRLNKSIIITEKKLKEKEEELKQYAKILKEKESLEETLKKNIMTRDKMVQCMFNIANTKDNISKKSKFKSSTSVIKSEPEKKKNIKNKGKSIGGR